MRLSVQVLRGSQRCVPLGIGLVFLAGLANGCGDPAPSPDSVRHNAPSGADFPGAGGRSLERVADAASLTNKIVVSPAGSTYAKGTNRFAFGVFSVAREQITNARVAIYAAPGARGRARGPFPARIDSLETEPSFESKTTADDPDSAKVLYVTRLRFDRPGEWRLLALLRQGNELLATRLPSIEVGGNREIPGVGEPAPRVHTPTASEVADLGEIDTRVPHDSMHDDDLADVLGNKPVILLFATPALCTSRVCGPVVDVAEQVKAETDEDVSFIHMEIFKDNDPNAGLRPQLEAFGLTTEPWLFVIDRAGRISTRIEGGFGVEELKRAVAEVSN